MIEEGRNVILCGVPGDAYYPRQLAVASNSGLTVIDEQSPRHYQHWCEHPEDDESSEALDFGKAFHMAVLEPEKFGDVYAVLPADAPRDFRCHRNAKKPSDATKASIDWWDTWEAANVGRVMLTSANYELASAMGAAMRAHRMEFDGGVVLTCGELFDQCEKEVTIFWTDEETGIRCKARADIHAPEFGMAGDIKSVLNADRESFARAITRHRYHVQHAHYSDGFRTCGQPLRTFPFFCAEKARPHVCATWHIDAMAEERGYALRRRALGKLKTCLETGEWPGYTRTLETLTLPAWAFYGDGDD